MARRVRKHFQKAGLPPGTLMHIGAEHAEAAQITVIDYDKDSVRERRVADVSECETFRDKPTVTWINVDGLQDLKIIESLGRQFGLHPLVLEDIVSTAQRPKVEDYGQTLFVVVKMLHWDEQKRRIWYEQVSFVLGSNFVLSFQETTGDVFDLIRARIRSGKGLVRTMGADYLLYALLDAIVDFCFVALEKIGDQIEELEDREISNPSPATLRDIRRLKREMIDLRRAVWPLREVVNGLERGKNSLVTAETNVYLRDLYDHSVRVIETSETYRDMLSGVLDIYLSSVSNRMNEVMKVLTIIATIFMPLTFLAGVYGMNFAPDSSPWNMPELRWRFGYPAVLAVMAIVAIVMILYFRRKKWL